MTANSQIRPLILVHFNHVAIKLQFQFVVFGIFEKSHTDFLANNLSPNVVLSSQTESHLFQNQFNFFSSFHRTVSFYLQFLHNFGCFTHISFSFLKNIVKSNFICVAVWKNDKFTASQILREINFGESTSSKSAIFPVLEALDF